MKRINKMKRILISWLCVVTLVAGYFCSVPLKSNAASGTYTELTFRDWGFGEEGTVTQKTDSTATPITSWDNVAISGHVKFKNTDNYWNQSIAIGADENTDGIAMRYSAGKVCLDLGTSGNVHRESKLEPRLDGVATEFDFRMTFTPVDNDNYRVDVTAGTVSQSYTVAKSALSLKTMQLYVNGGSEFDYKSTPLTTEYKEVTFRDWGFGEEGTVTQKTDSTATPITSWDNVAISGHVKFKNTDNYWNQSIAIGADENTDGIAMRYSAGKVCLDLGTSGNVHRESKLEPRLDGVATEFDFRITFTPVDNDNYRVDVTAGTVSQSYTVAKSTLSLKTMQLYVNGGSEFDYKSITVTPEPSPEPKTEFTFKDWGFEEEGRVTETISSTESPITSWDGMEFYGTLKFGTNHKHDDAAIFVGTTQWRTDGLRIRYEGNVFYINDGTDAHLLEFNTNKSEFGFRMKFTLEGTDTYNVEVTVGEETQNTTIAKSSLTLTSIRMWLRAAGCEYDYKSSIETPEPSPEPKTKLTFSDWGFGEEGRVTANTTSPETPITSWDNVEFYGRLKFNDEHNFDNAGIFFGASRWAEDGMRLRYANNNLYLSRGSSDTRLFSIFTGGPEFDFRIKFTPTETDTYMVEITVGSESKSAELPKSIFANTNIYLYMFTAGKEYDYKSIQELELPQGSQGSQTPAGQPTRDLSEYKMVTFKDFGVNTGEIKKKTVNCRAQVTDLNGKVFKGKITFQNKADEADGILCIGGTEKNRWLGLKVGMSSIGGVYICESIYGSKRWDITPDMMGIKDGIEGKEIELSLTFDVVDARNVRVGVYINDVFCGEKFYQNLVKDFGATLMVNSTTTITIADSDTPWIKFLNSDVDLTYFGFSNDKWKEELKAASK